MNLKHQWCVFSFLCGLLGVVTACGSDDDKGGGGSSAKLESCKQGCDKQATAMCAILIPVDDCKALCDAHAQAPAACQDALKTLSDCQLAQTNICDASGCDAQETAYQQACATH